MQSIRKVFKSSTRKEKGRNGSKMGRVLKAKFSGSVKKVFQPYRGGTNATAVTPGDDDDDDERRYKIVVHWPEERLACIAEGYEGDEDSDVADGDSIIDKDSETPPTRTRIISPIPRHSPRIKASSFHEESESESGSTGSSSSHTTGCSEYSTPSYVPSSSCSSSSLGKRRRRSPGMIVKNIGCGSSSSSSRQFADPPYMVHETICASETGKGTHIRWEYDLVEVKKRRVD